MSLRKSINEKCKECIYDPHSGYGTWREQVEACTSFKCPLFAVRPCSRKGSKSAQGPAIASSQEIH